MSKYRFKGNGGQVPEPADTPEAEELLPVEPEKPDCATLLAQKEEELKKSQDRLLRLAAEMENTKKRIEREKADGVAFANESLIRDLLPVVDNLQRALEHSEKEADFQSLLDGVRMTLKGFLDGLAKFGCVPFESLGTTFDPNLHEAVMQQADPEHPDRTVIREFQKGYTLKDRLIRPAMVAVSKVSDDSSQTE